MHSILEFHEISKFFEQGRQKTEALRKVSFSLPAGQIVGLVGPDGAGKTTLLRLIIGLLTPSAGHIRIFGHDISYLQNFRSSISYMPQRFGLYEELTIQENLNLYADLYVIPKDERPHQFQRLLEFSRLTPFIHRQAGKLSGGMKQKLALACSLLVKPKILLLDEPSVGVDPLSRRELWQLVEQLVRNTETLVIWSTAYLDEAERCDSVLLLHEGRLLTQGNPAVLCKPLSSRLFSLTPTKKSYKRLLQRQLNSHPAVANAIIQGDFVRILIAQQNTIDQVLEQSQVKAIVKKWTSPPPRFEDSYMDQLFHYRSSNNMQVPVDDLSFVQSSDFDHQEQQIDIDVANLSKRFGNFWAVREISFQVRKGEIFGLLGPNGAGKSTTFRMLCGLVMPTDGSAKVAGMDLGHSPAKARNRLGYMSQKFSLYGELSVKENLAFFGHVYGLRGREFKKAYDKALHQFGLTAYEKSPSLFLPLGFKQRLALACALIHSPTILFLDEPTSGVDPITRRQFWQEIGLLADQGVTVLVTTHFMEEAEYCDRLGIIYRGQMIAQGTPDDLKSVGQGNLEKTVTLEDTFISLIQQIDQQGVRK